MDHEQTGQRASLSPTRKRVGIVLTDKGIAREGAQVKTKSGEIIGTLDQWRIFPDLETINRTGLFANRVDK